MKTIKITALMLMVSISTTFALSKEVNTEESEIVWTGKKIGGAHTGEIQLKSGELELKNNNIVGGKFMIDMNTITNSDLDSEAYKKKLVDHLKSDDFFGVKKYPTAYFEITSASRFVNNKAKVTGKVTIKGKTEIIYFDVEKVNNQYIASINVDRSKFDVRYGSNSFFDNLGDKAINDIFTLDVKLVL